MRAFGRTFVVVLLLWLLVCSPVTAWLLYARFSATNAARADNRRVWHAVICVVGTAEIKNPKMTVTQRRAVKHFWNDLLVNTVGASPCRFPSGGSND